MKAEQHNPYEQWQEDETVVVKGERCPWSQNEDGSFKTKEDERIKSGTWKYEQVNGIVVNVEAVTGLITERKLNVEKKKDQEEMYQRPR